MLTQHETADELPARARDIRRRVVEMCFAQRQGYVAQGLSLADLMAHLYFRVLRRESGGEFVDRFVLSTGHSAIAVYAALGELGVYSQAELSQYGLDGSEIEESPLESAPGFEVTGGSLGQGLSQALGLALGLRLQRSEALTYCLVSDGELQEGQVWEAVMAISHYRLDNIVILIDNNNQQSDGPTSEIMTVEPLEAKFEAFGIATIRINGHDHDALRRALPSQRSSRSAQAVILDTHLGMGSPTIEARPNAHYVRFPEVADWERILAEVS